MPNKNCSSSPECPPFSNDPSANEKPNGFCPSAFITFTGGALLRKLFFFAISLGCLALGSSLSMKAAIGVGAYDAIAQTLSFITPWKVGTYYIALNLLWLTIHLFLCKKIWNPKLYGQLLLIFGFGFLLDFFYYDLLGDLVLTSYPLRWMVLLLAICIASFGVSLLLSLDFIAPPLESFFMEVTLRLGKNFGPWRQALDFVFIGASVLLTLLFQVGWTVREGTLFSALCFGPLIAFFLPWCKKLVERFLGSGKESAFRQKIS